MDPLATLKRKNADKLNFDRCALCQDIKKVKRTSRCESLRSTPDGISRVRETAVERKELGEHSKLLNTLDKVTDSDWASGKIVYHNSRYSSFTSRSKIDRLIKKKEKDSNVSENKEGNRRVSIRKSQCVNWKRCVSCQTESENDDNIRHVETLQLSERILSKSKHDLILCAKLAGVIDLVAAEAIYHLPCLVQFDKKMSKLDTQLGQMRDEAMDTVCSVLSAGLKQGNVYSV